MPDLSLVTMLFIGVNLDFFVVLLLLLQKYRFRDNFIGYELGMLLVFVISAIAGQLIQTIIPTWAIGLLSLLPIYMGIKGENDDVNNSSKSTSNGGMTAVLLMYLISCGADNIAVYVPVLATMTTAAILLTLGYFIILTAISLILAYLFGQIPIVKYVFERWGSPISRIIYILIGLFVMLNTGLIQFIFNLF
ncbi:cadmium resistance transporter [Leuconostoc gelidum]|uniref:cadmium resistance transporter n=1 Tax=Leuconostoc gelidum TaxID=1244 RepID=UPI001C7CC9C9|nr:cadmium resistance transporter [Leuconostoc gelidum]MBZ6009848.1 cadmium resistance transporter [Leuconostoc gelidum subsp. aenigmaticum]